MKIAQELAGHNCAVYVDINFDTMIYGKGLKGDFKTKPETVLTNKRKEMVTVNNNAPETKQQYTFVDDPNVERAMKASLQTHHDEKSWSKDKFLISTVMTVFISNLLLTWFDNLLVDHFVFVGPNFINCFANFSRHWAA